VQILPLSVGRCSATGATMSDPDLTRLPGTIAAMVSMAAVHVYCTGGRNAVIVAPQVCDSLSRDV
jgi:hypothetical protein